MGCLQASISFVLQFEGAKQSLNGTTLDNVSRTRQESNPPEKQYEQTKSKGKSEDKRRTRVEDVRNMANFNILIATIMLTITFSAGIQVPGGFNNDGKANLQSNPYFKDFLINNSIAFGCSAAAVLVYFIVGSFPK